MDTNTKCSCKTIRSVAHLNIQYAHRFYGFKGEARRKCRAPLLFGAEG